MGRNNVSSGAKLAPFCRRVGKLLHEAPAKVGVEEANH